MTTPMGAGQVPSKVMIVGDTWYNSYGMYLGADEAELNKMLHEAGIITAECYQTCVVNQYVYNPVAFKKSDITLNHVNLYGKYVLPIVREGFESLLAEIELVKPNVIVCIGELAFYLLTGATGIKKWRGSQLVTRTGVKLIPTYHPSSIRMQWTLRSQVVIDLKRVKKEMQTKLYADKPAWHFILRPSFDTTINTLKMLLERAEKEEFWLDFDLETRAGHTACAGLSWSMTEAICIPFMCVESIDGYWIPEEEAEVVWYLYKVLTHKHIKVRGQNLLYDAQYTYRHWHFVPNVQQDTMISHHTCFASLQKSLAFQASMYCDYYVYWKDDGKTWTKDVGEDQLWSYNCEDCIRTREVGETSAQAIEALKLQEVEAFQQQMFWPVLQAMQRGVKVNKVVRKEFGKKIQTAITEREELIEQMLGYPLNSNSPKQMCALFYDDLQQQKNMKKATRRTPAHVTCDDEALQKIASREPLLKPLINAITEQRTLKLFDSNFIKAELDPDGRMRCSYNICGTITYRLSSSENAFGCGTNLQVIPSDKSKSSGKLQQRGSSLTLPNIKEIFVPDEGFTFFDSDLDRADLQVVVWEADDEMLKAALRMGADIHLLNTFVLDGQEPPPLDELVETHPKYIDHRAPRKLKREFAKVFCHATNYVGSARTVAGHTGRLVREIERAQAIWFGAHPGIKKWHQRIEEQIQKRRYVENQFGFRWYLFDRLDNALPQAVAWIPQSTVGTVINKYWLNLYNNVPEVWVLLQVHDSLAGQFPTHKKDYCLRKMEENNKIVIPYDDPLIIPIGISTSEVSWGQCK